LKHFGRSDLVDRSIDFPIELISNLIRPFSLGIRLFGTCLPTKRSWKLYRACATSNLVRPDFVDALSAFVALVQTFVFILLSQLYLSEVSHAPHDHSHDHADEPTEETGDEFIVPV
jgi:F-type H+-transporting ATPase subunit a